METKLARIAQISREKPKEYIYQKQMVKREDYQ